MKKLAQKIAHTYHRMHWFSDADAWLLFRLAAAIEAVGWTLLISAIIARKMAMPGADIMVSMAGTLHGVFFLVFFVILLVTARSMAWGPWRVIGGFISGNVPFMSVVFARIVAWHRKTYPVYVPLPAGYDEE